MRCRYCGQEIKKPKISLTIDQILERLTLEEIKFILAWGEKKLDKDE
jgi:hypothetical protein